MSKRAIPMSERVIPMSEGAILSEGWFLPRGGH